MRLQKLRKLFCGLLTLAFAASAGFAGEAKETRKLILIAGKASHGPGLHEFNAGSILFKKCLEGIEGLEVEVHNNGWVSDDKVLETADAIVIYADGGGGHPALQGNHQELLQKAADRGAGLMMMHYATECPKDGPSGDVFRDWIGGAYENSFSVNPIWEADYKSFPVHPIARGVEPFKISDEWYFSIRFQKEVAGIQSLLVATPSDETRDGPYVNPKGPYSHIQARKGEEETMMWCKVREDGGRGVGFTGGHFHKNWADDDFRKIVLSAMLWISKIEVPETGVASAVTQEQMEANIDYPKKQKKQ